MPLGPELTVPLILTWADAHHERTGLWPKTTTGPVRAGLLGENWRKIDNALRYGLRGLPGGSSLAQLLDARRGVRNVHDLLMLTEARVAEWAVTHHGRTGAWPNEDSGPVIGAPGEVWANINQSLREGRRGFTGGSSLAQLLASRLGVRNRTNLPPLTIKQILEWADRHRERASLWPRSHDGPIREAPEETWTAIDSALTRGLRGLPGGSSLAQLLAKHRGVRNPANIPPLTIDQILDWADRHHERMGRWPSSQSGPVVDARSVTWGAIDQALDQGLRGLPGGSSLAQLLAEHRGARNRSRLPRLTKKQIREWARAHYERTGKWPTAMSGPISGVPGQTWRGVEMALIQGHRGLKGRETLARVLAERRGARNRAR